MHAGREFAQKAVLVIPAYRPLPALVGLVTEMLEQDGGRLLQCIVVVDDGSGTEFEDVFRGVMGLERTTILRHAVNLGKGAALKTGINYALVTWPDIVGIVTADADGQHAPGDVLRVAEALVEDPSHIRLGVRQFDGNVPLRSRFGNSMTRAVFHAFSGLRLSDTQTGLRGWPRPFCGEILRIAVNGYDFETECLIVASRFREKTVALRQMPIRTIYADGNPSSHFNPLWDSMRIYVVFARYCGTGALAALLDTLMFYLTLSATGNLALSQAAGRVLAMALAFVLARNVVFHSSARVLQSLMKYVALVVAMGIVSYSLIQLLHTRFGLPVIASKLIAEGLLFVGNFAIQRDFIFVKR